MAAACVVVLLFATASASAQTPAPAPRPQSVATDVTEPDFALVNLPTTRPMKRFRGSFHLTHRFLGNLRQASFKDNLANVFGLDNGAVIGLEYRFALTDTLEAVFYRNSADKTIQLSAKFDAIRQSDRIPVSLSVIGSIEGNQNFGLLNASGHDHTTGSHEHKAPAIAAVLSRTVGMHAALYAVPAFVHNSLKLDDTSHRNTFFVGLGGRLRVRPTVFLVGEVTPRFAGYAPGSPEFGFGIEKRAGGHMFQLTFSNATATTFGQVARGGFPTTIYLGFNLGRRF